MQFLLNYQRQFSPNQETKNHFVWKHKRSQVAKASLTKKNRNVIIMVSEIWLYHKAIGFKTLWQCHKKRNID